MLISARLPNIWTSMTPQPNRYCWNVNVAQALETYLFLFVQSLLPFSDYLHKAAAEGKPPLILFTYVLTYCTLKTLSRSCLGTININSDYLHNAAAEDALAFLLRFEYICILLTG